MSLVQLNLHETDLLFRYLSHHLTWHCFSISEDLQEICSIWMQNCFCYCSWTIFRRATRYSETITKTILPSYAANFFQICANLQKSWNNMMSNDSLIIENMDLCHVHLAVFPFTSDNDILQEWRQWGFGCIKYGHAEEDNCVYSR